MQVVPVPLSMLAAMATLRISIPTDLRPPEARKATLLTLRARARPAGPRHRLMSFVLRGVQARAVAATAQELRCKRLQVPQSSAVQPARHVQTARHVACSIRA
jgi:hypothetical protein